MKTRKYSFITLFLVIISSTVYCQSWQWNNAVYEEAPGNSVSSITTDEAGNVYATGFCQVDTLVIGSYTLTNMFQASYFVKYNSAGGVDWVKVLSDSVGAGLITTDKLGNVYLSGLLWGSYTTGAFSLKSPFREQNFFIAKYDSNGNAMWGIQTQVNSFKCRTGIESSVVDNSGDIYITGSFADTVSIGAYTLTMKNNNMQSNMDVFVAKIGTNGNVLWAQQSKTPSIQNRGALHCYVATDNQNGVYITGGFIDSTSFGGYYLVSDAASYLVKYSSSGVPQWAKSFIGSQGSVSAIICNKAGNVCITGSFQDSASFFSKTLYGTSQSSIFLAQFDGNGNLVWAEQSSPQWMGNSLAADARGNIYLGGTSTAVTGSLQFGSFSLTNPLPQPASFIARFDPAGNPSCGSMLNCTYIDAPNLIATDTTGNYTYMSGEFHDTLFYNNSILVEPIYLSSYSLTRWQSCADLTGVPAINNPASAMNVYPNPFTNTTTVAITSNGQHYLEVDDVTGRKMQWIEFTGTQYQLSAEGLAKGIYFIRAFGSNYNVIGTNKIVVQ